MTHVDAHLDRELAALRTRRPARLSSWIRTLAPFDRRAIREPGERDIYWSRIHRRLVESDAAWILTTQSGEPAPRLISTTDVG